MKNRPSELVSRAQSGETAAFDALIRQERSRLEAFVRGRLGGHLAPKVGVEDVLQETCLRALRDIRLFERRGDGSFFRWLCGIASHVILEAARKGPRAATVSLDFEVSADCPSPSRAARREERFDRLEKALDSLRPEHRQVILLVRVEGLPVKEVAKRMNRTPHAVSGLLLRASQRLREVLGQTESLRLPARRLGEKREGRDD